MAYKVIILYRLYMPSYFLGTFTEYPYLRLVTNCFYCNCHGLNYGLNKPFKSLLKQWVKTIKKRATLL